MISGKIYCDTIALRLKCNLQMDGCDIRSVYILGVVLSEHLDYDVIVKFLASRALGLLIAKCKSIGGVPYDVFTKLNETGVWPVISYSAPIWSFPSYSYIDAMHNRAMRFNPGVGKYKSYDAIAGEIGWKPTSVRQWKIVCSYWAKLTSIYTNKLNERIALWAASKSNSPNWKFSEFLTANYLSQYTDIAQPITSSVSFVQCAENKVFENFVVQLC